MDNQLIELSLIFFVSAMVGILAVSWLISRLLIGRLYKSLFANRNKEITILATVAVAFVMLMVSQLGFFHSAGVQVFFPPTKA